MEKYSKRSRKKVKTIITVVEGYKCVIIKIKLSLVDESDDYSMWHLEIFTVSNFIIVAQRRR